MNNPLPIKYFYASFILILAMLFYAYEFSLQSSPGVMTQELLRDFNLNAASLSITVAFFFYAYAPTQLAGGILYDRFGPRVLLSLACLICTLGAGLFALSHGIQQLAFSRLLMGLGGAFSFVGVLVLASRWFAMRHFALIAGILQTLACFGAVAGQVPLAVMIHAWGWRQGFYVLFIIGMVLTLCLAIFVRNWPKAKRQQSREQHKAEKLPLAQIMKQVFSKSQTWWAAVYSFAIWTPVVVFANLWGIPFVVASYHVTTTMASSVVMMMWLGLAFGSPLFGWWSAKINKRCLPLTVSGFLGAVAGLIALYVPMPLVVLYVVMFVFGMGSSGQTLIFALVQDNNKRNVVGTAMGFNNLAVVAGGAILQPVAGWLLKLHWHQQVVHGVPIYSMANYRLALLLVPLGCAIAFLVSTFLLKETHCRGVVD